MDQEIKSKLLASFVLVEEGELTPFKAMKQMEELIDEGTEKLTFGELEQGDKFICFPRPGDNSGHGGYKPGHRIFYKWPDFNGGFCSKSFTDGTFSTTPDSMEVIKII